MDAEAFHCKYIQTSILEEASMKKIKKYESIKNYAERCLKDNEEMIRMKYQVKEIRMSCRYVVIGNLGIVPKTTEVDFYSITDVDET
jgi:hypothetical protein